jgi:hypothetical protein
MVLTRPWDSGFAIKNIEGLGPVKGTINTSKVSTLPGERYNSGTVGGRNITFDLHFLEFLSIEDSRHRSYQYFPVLQPITMIFESDTRMAAVKGYVESNEPMIFSKESGTKISIICEDAYFYDASDQGTVTTKFFTVVDMFEFPFENRSLTTKLLQLGQIQTEYSKDIIYRGDSEAGVTINIEVTGDVGDLIIYTPTTNEAMRINSARLAALTGFGLISGDRITIVTTRGKKSIKLTRAGTIRNIWNALERTSSWLKMTKGINQFAYSASYGASNVQIVIESQILYEGL